jgi:hypothetical protein
MVSDAEIPSRNPTEQDGARSPDRPPRSLAGDRPIRKFAWNGAESLFDDDLVCPDAAVAEIAERLQGTTEVVEWARLNSKLQIEILISSGANAATLERARKRLKRRLTYDALVFIESPTAAVELRELWTWFHGSKVDAAFLSKLDHFQRHFKTDTETRIAELQRRLGDGKPATL